MTGPPGAGGRTVGSRYRLIEPVGRGGMGTVWRAYDEVLGRTVAVKEVDLPQLGEVDRAALRERTMREARAAARLSHPNAVTVYDVLEEDGQPWIIMALVPAKSLAQVIRAAGPLPPARVARIGPDVLSALQAAHAAGILHRDVKPGNVLLGDDGRTVLTDFGIATLEGDSSLTSTGLLMGAPAYIAPERARGLRPGPASDLWSLGATLYAAVEGRPPYDRDTPLATLTALISEEPPAPRSAGPLAPVLMALLERDPERRIDAAEARGMLQGALAAAAGQPDPTRPVPAPEPATGSRTNAAWTQVLPLPDAVPPLSPQTVVSSEPAGASALTEHAPRAPAAPVRPAARPVRAVPAPGSRRSAMIVGLLALAVLAAALAGVLLGTFHRGGRSPTPTSSAQRPSATPSARPSASPTPKPTPSPTPSPTRAASASPSPAGSTSPTPPAGGAGVPAGFVRYTDPTGFSVAVPAGWQKTRNRGFQVDFQEPGTGRFLRFGHTSSPPADPVADWTRQEKSLSTRLPRYQRLYIRSVPYRGYSAADWAFTFGGAGGRTEVLIRGFSPDSGHGYAIYLSAPQSQWAASLPYFETAASTFQPG